MVSCGDSGDYGELEHVDNGKCDELAWRIQAGTRDTESTWCVIWQARQLVDRCACECYERRGMMYLRQSCRAGSMRDHTSKKGQRYGGVTGSVSDWLHVTVYG